MPGSVISTDLKQYSIDSTQDELWSSQRDLFRFIDLSFYGLPFVFTLWGESTIGTRGIGGSGGSGSNGSVGISASCDAGGNSLKD